MMPFHAQEDACGNALVTKEHIHWDAETHTFAISLNTLIGAKSVRTIRLSGTINGRIVHVLVDSGSTNSFINSKSLQRVGLIAIEIDHRPIATKIDHGLRVEVANGQHMFSKLCCQDARIKFINDFESASDLLALDMGPIDVVLGYDSLQSLGKINMDFKALSLSFVHKGRWITLHGIATSKL